MYKNYINIKFFISWWAFTFPMAAVSIATILMYQLTHDDFYAILSYLFMAITLIVVFLVARQTIIHMLKKEICIME
jgi:tellurite resistance protein